MHIPIPSSGDPHLTARMWLPINPDQPPKIPERIPPRIPGVHTESRIESRRVWADHSLATVFCLTCDFFLLTSDYKLGSLATIHALTCDYVAPRHSRSRGVPTCDYKESSFPTCDYLQNFLVTRVSQVSTDFWLAACQSAKPWSADNHIINITLEDKGWGGGGNNVLVN